MVCCCKMRAAILDNGEVPINFVKEDGIYGIEYPFEKDVILNELGEQYDAAIDFCPFCGENLSPCKHVEYGRWRLRPTICSSMLYWFNFEDDVDKKPFEYNHRNNQFYMRKRKGFGDGLIPIDYCIYCGEPLAEMIDRFGVPLEVQKSFHTDEWWRKRGL